MLSVILVDWILDFIQTILCSKGAVILTKKQSNIIESTPKLYRRKKDLYMTSKGLYYFFQESKNQKSRNRCSKFYVNTENSIHGIQIQDRERGNGNVSISFSERAHNAFVTSKIKPSLSCHGFGAQGRQTFNFECRLRTSYFSKSAPSSECGTHNFKMEMNI